MQRERLGELRRRAFEYNSMREFRHRVNREQMLAITGVLKGQSVPFEVLYQIRRDLTIYNVYDALAMWLDDGGGLAAYCPDGMIRVGTVLLFYADERKR